MELPELANDNLMELSSTLNVRRCKLERPKETLRKIVYVRKKWGDETQESIL